MEVLQQITIPIPITYKFLVITKSHLSKKNYTSNHYKSSILVSRKGMSSRRCPYTPRTHTHLYEYTHATEVRD